MTASAPVTDASWLPAEGQFSASPKNQRTVGEGSSSPITADGGKPTADQEPAATRHPCGALQDKRPARANLTTRRLWGGPRRGPLVLPQGRSSGPTALLLPVPLTGRSSNPAEDQPVIEGCTTWSGKLLVYGYYEHAGRRPILLAASCLSVPLRRWAPYPWRFQCSTAGNATSGPVVSLPQGKTPLLA